MSKDHDFEVPVHCAYDEMVELEKLKPNPRNPNDHPHEQLALLAKIIINTGWRNPITVSNLSGQITKGHGRLEAAQLAKLTHAPVDYQDYRDEGEEWADILADKKITSMSEWNYKELTSLVEELDVGDFDMELTGFNSEALEDLMTWTPEPTEKNEPEPSDNQPGERQPKQMECPHCGGSFEA